MVRRKTDQDQTLGPARRVRLGQREVVIVVSRLRKFHQADRQRASHGLIAHELSGALFFGIFGLHVPDDVVPRGLPEALAEKDFGKFVACA